MNIAYLELEKLVALPKGCHYVLHFTDDSIEDSNAYNNFISFCDMLTENDSIDLHISGYGGRCDITSRICSAIENTKAHVTAVVNGVVWSGMTFVTLACHSFRVGEFVEFGLHSVQAGVAHGEVKKIIQRAKAVEEYNNRLLDKYGQGFLTQEEIDKLHNGDEITFFYEELINRLNQRNDTRESEYQASLPKLIEDEITLEVFTNEELAEELKLIQAEIKKRKNTKKELLGETK